MLPLRIPTLRAAVLGALVMTLPAAALQAPAAALQDPAAALQDPAAALQDRAHDAPGAEAAPAFQPTRSIRDLMTAPLVQTQSDGTVWVRARDLRASFGQDGCTVYPVFGPASPQEWPVHFGVDAVTLGGEPLDATIAGPAAEGDGRVTIERGDLREIYRLGLDGIEQTFVFDALPGGGDLVVRMDVETELAVEDGPEGLRFVHETLGAVTYGDAFVIDADGREQAIERSWDGASLSLTVPAEFLASATMPVTIDPLIGAFTIPNTVSGPVHPDVTFAGGPGRYLITWEEGTSATNLDVYVARVATNGAYHGALPIDLSNQLWSTPRVAYVGANDRALVVASARNTPSPFSAGAIRGRLVDSASWTLVGSDFVVSTVGSPKIEPDIGGTNRTGLTNTHFLVGWSRELSGGSTRSLEYRVIDWDGSPVTDVVTIANNPGEHWGQLAISESTGDSGLGGHFWTMAFIRDTNQDGLGQVWARRVVWNGTPSSGNGTFVVQPTTFNSSPSVTSLFNDPLLATGQRPSVVAWDTTFITTGTTRRSVFARVIIDGSVRGVNAISTVLEDFDGTLDQFSPSIATDGKSFILVYSEGHWGTLQSEDLYMVSGDIARSGTDGLLALSERHKVLAGTSRDEHRARLAMARDGDRTLLEDIGACVFLSESASTADWLMGALVEVPTEYVQDDASVGIQYCDANPNSVGTGGGRNSSWMWIRGDQTTTNPKVAYCVDMPTNAFGFLLCSLSAGDTNFPGGSAGRLCLGGHIGRYVSQIASSGLSGTISATIDPTALPQPTGNVAGQFGQNWHFQFWHRDTTSGAPSSNFSNACRLTLWN